MFRAERGAPERKEEPTAVRTSQPKLQTRTVMGLASKDASECIENDRLNWLMRTYSPSSSRGHSWTVESSRPSGSIERSFSE